MNSRLHTQAVEHPQELDRRHKRVHTIGSSYLSDQGEITPHQKETTPHQRETTLHLYRAMFTLWISSLIITLLSVGCTIIRDGEGEGEGGSDGIIGEGGGTDIHIGGGGHEPMTPLDVDLLVLAPFDQTPIAEYYSGIIIDLMSGLVEEQLEPQKVAIAPMYSRINTEVPLIYGLNDPESEFNSYRSAMEYFTSNEGLNLLTQDDVLDGANLIDLGRQLGTTAIYHPLTAAAGSRYYFEEPRDGLVIIWINAQKRRCELSGCALNEGNLGDLLTSQNPEGEAEWLLMGGMERMRADRIIHLFINTQETENEDLFFERCGNQAGFPARVLDYIEPSPSKLYTQLQDRLRGVGLPSLQIDFCEALSVRGVVEFERVASNIRATLSP